MIYTVTFNPSLDYVIGLDTLSSGHINRTTYEHIYPGGKGINVSVILSNLGCENKALGFVAGFTGEELERRMQAFGCQTEFIHVNEGLTRINVKIHANEETEINGQGSIITTQAMQNLYEIIEKMEDDDIFVLAGSIPKSMPENSYELLIERIKDKKIRLVVDTTKDMLLSVLRYHPFLIKPNKEELEEISKRKLLSDEEVITAAKELQEMGARNVLVSMAGDGALLLDENGIVYRRNAVQGIVKNSVGAGDSMVAGFLAGYMKNGDYNEALKLGMAAGSATAFTYWLATKEEIDEIFTKSCNCE